MFKKCLAVYVDNYSNLSSYDCFGTIDLYRRFFGIVIKENSIEAKNGAKSLKLSLCL
eukprot:UN18468